MFQLVRPRRRRSLRRSFRARCQAVRLDGFRLFGEHILDLSPRGALVSSDGSAHPGDEIVLSFQAPHGGPWIDVVANAAQATGKVGEIARIVADRRVEDPGFCAGVRFATLEKEAQQELLVRLAGYPPPVPSRRPPVDYAETIRRVGAITPS